jgi:aspartate kinase
MLDFPLPSIGCKTGGNLSSRPPPRKNQAVSAAAEPRVETVVMKFGGSSVGEPEQVRDVARRLVAAHERGLRVVGTISAMGRTTDALLELARRVSASPDPRELDMLLSTGERTACALVAMAVHDLGHEAVSFTGSQAGILTDAVYTKAKIREITPVRVLRALDEGKIVLVAGYQGFSRDTMDVTTLGRGGTDATAVALAAALGAACEIYSDVPGVFTADPRIVPEARKLPTVSYEEMLEMAASGAGVLMLRAVELARGHDVPIHARSTFTNEPGTLVRRGEGMEQALVTAVTHSLDEVVFVLHGLPDEPGSVAAVFDAVARENVNVDTILQNVPRKTAELSFSVPADDVPAARRAVVSAQESLGAFRVEEIDALGKVSLIGAGMRSHPGVAARMFRALADEAVSLRLISTSPIKISCMIDRGDVETAVRALHDAFALGE